jgi:hypothetical protein
MKSTAVTAISALTLSVALTALAANDASHPRFKVRIAQGEQPFDQRSASVDVGCEENGSASVTYYAPSGWKIIEAQARWVDASNLKQMDAAVVDKQDLHAQASGNIRGVDNQIIWGVPNCPGGGHATLSLYGRIAPAP